MLVRKKKLLEDKIFYRPFDYPVYVEGWERQVSMFWTIAEISLDLDRKQYYELLTEGERKILMRIFCLFTQMDVEVSKGYTGLLQVVKPYEAKAMVAAFLFMETIHVKAYEGLSNSLKIPETIFQEFVKYKAMSAKYDYINTYKLDSPYEIARTMAFMSGFIEGFCIFSAFCILICLSVSCGYMKGTAQVSILSMRDETLHNKYMTHMFHDLIKEYNDQIDLEKLEKDVVDSCCKLIELEDQFIDECFAGQEMRGITVDEVKSYIRRLAEIRIRALGFPFPEQYKYDPNHYPKWMDEVALSREMVDFFSGRPTEYAKLMKRTWKDIINEDDDSDDWSSI